MTEIGEVVGARPLTADDVLLMELIDGVALAPAGDRVALTVRTADEQANRYYSRVDIIPTGDALHHAACWSPDGRRLARYRHIERWFATYLRSRVI